MSASVRNAFTCLLAAAGMAIALVSGSAEAYVVMATSPGGRLTMNLAMQALIGNQPASDAMAQWKSWARVLGVPLLVADDDGALREPFRRIGRLAVGQPAPRRRRRSAIKWRRPSILMRRKPGRPSANPSVYRGEREIIARN